MVRLTRNIDTRNAVMTSNVYRCTKFKRDSIAIRNELCEALSRPTQNFICGFAPQKWKVTKETLEIKGQELRSVFFFSSRRVKYSSVLKEIYIKISTVKWFLHTGPPFLNIGTRLQ